MTQSSDDAPSDAFAYAVRGLIRAYQRGELVNKEQYLSAYCARGVDREGVWREFTFWAADEEGRIDEWEQYQTRSLILGRKP